MSKQFTEEEVAKHNQPGDLWIVVDSKVYDLSRFADMHPGGPNVLFVDTIAGKDATQAFFGLHRLEVLERPQYKRLVIGTLHGQKSLIKPPPPGAISSVPYAEASWLVPGFRSPYFTERHRKFQAGVRTFFEEVVKPAAIESEDSGKKIPQEVVDKMAEVNIIAMRLGPGKHLQGRKLLNGLVEPEEFDYFHELIINTELARFGTRGFIDGILAGAVIGLPPVLNFGSPELKARIVPEVFGGKKYIALAITEAFAGSDVSGIQTVAVREGDYWVITGTKKWITNGHFADYFTTLCKTDTGFTVILVERSDSVNTKAIKTSYSPTAGTAFVTFNRARVPVGNTLGQVGNGMKVILSNFNHERWMVTCTALAAQRVVVEECLKWASQRVVFGKPLHAQPVIRAKLAGMISRVEAGQNWLESVTHNMNNMTYAQTSELLAGPIALCKQFVGRCGTEIGNDAAQIFGGRAITVTGMGKVIENFRRTTPFDAILAGAEDVMADLGVRQALKKMPSNARL
ncbi:Cytochrome b5 heme-binding domain-containing protein [Mycena indigotica]|uniref:Cytochrome b5 heme-binding domain-containing protein n=1 Tax=Mycena indigotica TaxID=2126181 RepID=A0A8H6SLM5_9AGAR|nr:Cytochrome b5 heme-binding domain-containing protein [Mycena indigotica]KAF7301283.1 Cytochrome b5 heme-binding domain-containing protein [Mycena indigotica]